MSECFAVWYFASHMGLEVEPRTGGRGSKCLEFSLKLPDGDIKVEVKAPYCPVKETSWWGNNSKSLCTALKRASEQFDHSDRNLLVIVPKLRAPVFWFRAQFEEAFIGKEVIRVRIDTGVGGHVVFEEPALKENGRLVKKWPSENKETSVPFFTSIGAVLCLQEEVQEAEIKPRALIVHNPNAKSPLPKALWQRIPEFLFCEGKGWAWSDMIHS